MTGARQARSDGFGHQGDEPVGSVEPFSIRVPDATLRELSDRLTRSRFIVPTDAAWKAGTDPTYLRELVAYSIGSFDWRSRERELNTIPQFVVRLNDRLVHFLHLRAASAAGRSMPLLLTHGWPSSFLEFLPLIRMLTDPVANGADPGDAFDVVVPSIPGFAFSELPADGIVTPARIADLWTSLMTVVLGYERFGAYGGDLGSHVTDFLGAMHPDQVLGIYTRHPRLSPDLSKGPALTPRRAGLPGKPGRCP